MYTLKQWSPTRDQFHARQFSHRPGEGDGFRMVPVHYIYYVLYFYYCYISSTLGHQALDPGDGRPLA